VWDAARRRQQTLTLTSGPVASQAGLDFPAGRLKNPDVARVVIEHLSKTYGGPKGEGVRAVDDLTLTVEDHESFVLVGPSGCGKTTTLRLIAGLEQASAGRILFDGQEVTHWPPKERDVAMVFQQPALYPHLTVRENLAFGLRLRKCPWSETDRRVGEAAEMLGLTGVLARLPMGLSGGQRQRVAVGRAMVRRPRVFLFDEPFTNLDPQTRARLRAELARLHEQLGSTAIYVTHDQAEALALGDRVAVMREGRIQQVDRPMDLYLRPANLFVAGLVGSPPMNLFPGIVLAGGQTIRFSLEPGQVVEKENGVLSLGESVSARLGLYIGKKVILGLRPEHLRLHHEDKTGEQTIEATVKWTESLGPETHLHLTTAGNDFVARAAPGLRLEPGQRVAVSFDLRYGRYFDPLTQAAIA
jgi:multiple sugar transport system ATP-binding protein